MVKYREKGAFCTPLGYFSLLDNLSKLKTLIPLRFSHSCSGLHCRPSSRPNQMASIHTQIIGLVKAPSQTSLPKKPFFFFFVALLIPQVWDPEIIPIKHLSTCLRVDAHQMIDVPVFSSVQFSSVARSCPTFCNPMNRSMPDLPLHHQLPEFTQTHVHQVGDAIQPSHPLSSPSPPAPNPSQHQGLFQWVNSSHKVAKVLEFQLQRQSFQWTPRADLL